MRWGPDEAVLSYPIFLEPLEKGRRARGPHLVRVAGSGRDEQQLLEFGQQLQTGSLPLTA